MSFRRAYALTHLNEVLSIRAQEWVHHLRTPQQDPYLNEVLSIRAQEFDVTEVDRQIVGAHLNEVLSIRAQESEGYDG